eukprot:7368072-Prymnesium_polylepis.1
MMYWSERVITVTASGIRCCNLREEYKSVTILNSEAGGNSCRKTERGIRGWRAARSVPVLKWGVDPPHVWIAVP